MVSVLIDIREAKKPKSVKKVIEKLGLIKKPLRIYLLTNYLIKQDLEPLDTSFGQEIEHVSNFKEFKEKITGKKSGKIVLYISGEIDPSLKSIKNIIENSLNDSDITIGITGLKKANSSLTSFITKTIFKKTRKLKSLQSGLFAVKKEILLESDIDLSKYNPVLETVVKGKCKKIREREIKLNNSFKQKKDIKSFIKKFQHLIELSWNSGEIARFIKFCVVGGIGAILNLTVLYLLTSVFSVYYLFSGAIAIETGLLSNFFLNKSWTFRDRNVTGVRHVTISLGRDHVVRSGGIILNLSILWFLTDIVGLYYLLSQIIGIGIASIWNFGGNKWWTWK